MTMSENISFLKMNGAGNDFVVIDERFQKLQLTSTAIKNICHRHYGVGCDQLIILSSPKDKKSHIFMKIYNQDGSVSSTCGNATRCVAALMFAELEQSEILIETSAGILKAWVDEAGHIQVDMGAPSFVPSSLPVASQITSLEDIPLNLETLTNPSAVSMGNPHLVFIVEDVEKIDISALGSKIENHEFFPEKINVEFVQVINKKTLRMRVWERGSGLTLACGSGACASLVIATQRGLIDSSATIIADGGNLEAYWDHDDDHVILSGPVSIAFGGTLSPKLWEEGERS